MEIGNSLFYWLEHHGGAIDRESVGITTFAGQGYGAIARRNIPEGHCLFTLPRELTLSTRTSALPTLLSTGANQWKSLGLARGWSGLILCMMWEETRGDSRWREYLGTLPTTFDTPMFWSTEELEELKGTSVADKIGRAEAEQEYHERIVPAIRARPDLFPLDLVNGHYTLERFHTTGSRILSRCFTVERWLDEDEAGNDANNENDDRTALQPGAPQEVTSGPADSAMDNTLFADDGDDEDEEAEEEDGSSDVAMVPMADILNARYGCNNAKLFYEQRHLRMMAIKDIKAGEQIWNTYGEPPNSDLLRRYGHLDLLPVDGETMDDLTNVGCPSDNVEIRADLVVRTAGQSEAQCGDRVDWWLEEGEDDVFVMDTSAALPLPLISFIRLLLLSSAEWRKTHEKGKIPKPKPDSIRTVELARNVLNARLAEYPTTFEEDAMLLSPTSTEPLSSRRKSAIIVRMGEKRILRTALERVAKLVQAMSLEESGQSSTSNDKKRKREGGGTVEGRHLAPNKR